MVGPTATGKSDVAIELATRLGAEVINGDAFQVYRGMDIGTAKVPPHLRRGVPHHLMDILAVDQPMSVAQYQDWGRAALHALASRDVPAVIVGGSGLYVRALLDDLQFPGSDPTVRAAWEEVLAEVGSVRLHAILAERDPEAARIILPTNARRIVRALEAGQVTGRPFVAALPHDGPPCIAHVSVGLDLVRSELDERIQRRVDRMFDRGFVDEVRDLLRDGLRSAPTARRALGYPQVIDLIDGAVDLRDTKQAIVNATRRYARRQQRWFRRDPRTTWFDASAGPSSTASSILARIADRARTLGP